ncbi:MFS transporter [Paraliomyxa miuraensis]|uniref:MFS transporter n=1 Tax=Paraliomyxa miuraensis TaxID=376150 RepID=UPI0022530460|nr:MFS transporter [Paraliomyxa miuraensis]MCX4242274.1 MFS transporter [Paraliomyxa miuraensis]
MLRHAGLRRLWAGDLVSMLGDWLTYVAVGVLAIEHGGALAVLGVLLAHTVPRALVAPWAGRVADRHDRRTVLVLGSMVRGATVLGMVVAASADACGWVQALLVARMAAGAFVDAAAGAAVPRLVPSAVLPEAHALLGTTWSVVFGVGVAAGGVVTAVVGPVGALVADAVTFFVAAAIYAGLPRLDPSRDGDDSGRARRWSEVLAYVWARPSLRRAALTKGPVMLANGVAFVLAHAIAGREQGAAVAMTLGTLHLWRAVGTGIGPILWIRIRALRGTETGLRAALGVVVLGVGTFVAADGVALLWGLAWSLGWLGALLWGLGVGAHWATAAARLQQLTPDPLRGRLTAIDLVVHTAGQGLGGLLGAMVLALLACRPTPRHEPIATVPTSTNHEPEPTPTSTPRPLTLEQRLDAHAVTADDHVRLVLYTWTTPLQIEALRAGGPLLVADASTGGHASPFNRRLAEMVEQRRPGHEIAALLHERPGLTKRRYAWPSPFGTVLGKGPQRYGSALIRVELRPQAVFAALDPSVDPPWRFHDGRGRIVSEAEILAEPGRLGVVYHQQLGAHESIPFREHVLCNEAMVAKWSVGTAEIRERVEAERALMLELAEGPFGEAAAAAFTAVERWQAWPQWIDPLPPPTLLSRWHRTLAFDNARYRPTPAHLRAIADALADYDPTGPELWGPAPSDSGSGNASQASR